jgi:ketosteroid isomerase-like protein
VSAHDEIRALNQRYARAADERDIDALERVFHPDAEITGARGTASREGWLDTMRGPRAFPTSMHVLGDPLITMEHPDGDVASVDTYAVVYQLGDDASGSGDMTLGIRYLDTVERHDGRWVVTRRVAKTLWMR